MRTPVKIGGYALGLAAVFTAALGLGHITGGPPAAPAAPAAHSGSTGQHDPAAAPAQHPGTAAAPGQHASAAPGEASAHLPGGLQVTQDGYRLTPLTATLATGGPQPFRFRILGPDGTPVTRYARNHDKDLHLIVVRRDLSGFQHVHPALAGDGTWSIPLRVGAPGQYRVLADFQPAGHPEGLTLGVDVPAPGDYRPVALPAVSRTAEVDGYTVTLDGVLTPGTSSELTLTVTRGGVPVTDLEPYLGAYGHLVALRDGDLAYLHVHPGGRVAAGPEIRFLAEVPSAGTYRLYLDFQHDGRVRTAEFTATAGAVPPAATPAATPSAHGDHTHK